MAHETHDYMKMICADCAKEETDERVRVARREVWDAAIAVAQSFSDHYMARSVTIALRNAAEGEG